MIQCCGITCSGGPVIYATISDAFEMKIDSEMESQVRLSLSQIVEYGRNDEAFNIASSRPCSKLLLEGFRDAIWYEVDLPSDTNLRDERLKTLVATYYKYNLSRSLPRRTKLAR